MAKRFTDTDKWKKGFLRSLSSDYKLLWLYICDNCNHAGIWETELDVASMRLGTDYDLEDACKTFGNKIIVFDNGEKWFIPSFITFQYGDLNPNNRAHASVIKTLKSYPEIEKVVEKLEAPTEAPCDAPSNGAMDKDKEKDKEKNNKGEEEVVGGEEPTEPKKKKGEARECCESFIKFIDAKTGGLYLNNQAKWMNEWGKLKRGNVDLDPVFQWATASYLGAVSDPRYFADQVWPKILSAYDNRNRTPDHNKPINIQSNISGQDFGEVPER